MPRVCAGSWENLTRIANINVCRKTLVDIDSGLRIPESEETVVICLWDLLCWTGEGMMIGAGNYIRVHSN